MSANGMIAFSKKHEPLHPFGDRKNVGKGYHAFSKKYEPTCPFAMLFCSKGCEGLLFLLKAMVPFGDLVLVGQLTIMCTLYEN